MSDLAVLTGGSTPERDVALAGAAQVVRALRSGGHHVAVVDTAAGHLTPADEERLLRPAVGKAPPTPRALGELAAREADIDLVRVPDLRSADLVFIVLHGRQGEGGEVQALLDSAGVTYAGSGPLGSGLAMDKDIAKRLFRDAGIPTPAWSVWPVSASRIAALGLPLVVKPSKTGSTVGLTVVHDARDIERAVRTALAFDDEVLLEEFVPGREFTVGVLGDEALAVGEIIPSHDVFDYECKYTPGLTREVFPADLPVELSDRLRALGRSVHRTLKLRDFSRTDFRVGTDGTPQVLEANTLPGLTATSLFPQSAAAVGIAFDALCERICELALRRPGARNKVKA
jgi:D-alanine-D-alanine ligase